jgi:hypothetical protein
LTAAVNSYLSEKAGAEQSAKTAQDAIKAAQQQLSTAQQDVANWNASIAVLEAGIAQLPAAGQASDNKESGLGNLENAVQAAGDKQVQYVDANGKIQTQKIGDILKAQINVNSNGKPILDIPNAPGATLTILTLGVQLANMQKQAAEAKLSQLARRLQLYERVEAETELAYALLSDAGDSCQSQLQLPDLIVPPDRSFIIEASLLADEGRAEEQAAAEAAKSIAAESEQRREERLLPKLQLSNRRVLALASDLIKLRKLAIAQAVATRTSVDLSVNEPRLAHEESILDSQVNDAAWRTVIRSGVVVLDQYEQGGFASQDAADIIAIAQAIAVGVIAGRVN